MSGVKMYYENWHIKKEVIDAIESSNSVEAEKLIIKIKLKEFLINVLNLIFGFAVMFISIFILGAIVGLFIEAESRRGLYSFVGEGLLWTTPIAFMCYLCADLLKNNILKSIADFNATKKKRKK